MSEKLETRCHDCDSDEVLCECENDCDCKILFTCDCEPYTIEGAAGNIDMRFVGDCETMWNWTPNDNWELLFTVDHAAGLQWHGAGDIPEIENEYDEYFGETLTNACEIEHSCTYRADYPAVTTTGEECSFYCCVKKGTAATIVFPILKQ